ncbi:kinase-like domain-containing protein [Xylaria sp. FL0064]|nr:kinase-like domain-containing protein [Xylaria sp. FL0064]
MSRVYNLFFGSRYGAVSQQQQRYHFTIDEINERLHVVTTGPQSQGRKISEKTVREIQTLLRLLDDRRNRCYDAQWALRPRLYAILHNIQATEFMDDFIREHITDFNLPFNEQTLPQFIGQKQDGTNLRFAFFSIQDYYLTETKDIESEKSLHLTLSDSGDTHFISERPLGQGSFGSVDLVFSRLSTNYYARKRVLRSRGSEQYQKYLIQELRALRRLGHQHLVQIIGSYTDTEYIAYLMKPVASWTLEQFLSRSQPLGGDEKDLLRPFYGCLTGAMNYLHTHRIRHRDLTCRNILIDSSSKIYISDFGSSYNWESKPSSKTKHRNVPTSPDYMAPEVAKGDERGTKSDMWSLGIVFLEMTTKLLGHRLADLRSKIRHNAEREKVQPYAYANPTVVISWMKILGTTDTDYEHDKEPLGWVRELLHLGPEHRLTPPQLMRYVFESPSLHAFCCLKCFDDFQNEASTSSMTGPKADTREESARTRHEVE